MSNMFNIQLPPMPKPADFGITDDTWYEAAGGGMSAARDSAAKAKIKAYEDALAAWQRVAEAMRRQE
jgi:hypothetical protein